MPAEIELTELSLADSAHTVAEAHEQYRPRELLERNQVDRLPIDEEMPRRIDVRTGVGAEMDRRDVGAGSGSDGLLKRDIDPWIPRIDETTGADRNRDVVDAARRFGQEGRLVDSLALRVKRGISASNAAPFCRRNP